MKLDSKFGHNRSVGTSMYAIAFDLETAILKEEYGDPYNNAYFEVRKELEDLEFEWTQGSVYLYSGTGGLAAVYRAISSLSDIEWFKNPFAISEHLRLRIGLISPISYVANKREIN